MVRFLRGDPDATMMSRAVELQDAAMEETSWTEASVYTTPRSILGLQLMWSGALLEARATLEYELAEYERLGMYTVRQEVLCYLAELECRAGRYEVGAAYAAEAAETIAESGMAASQTHVVRFNQALAAAYLGRVDEARSLATEGLELARANDDAFNGAWNGAVLGFLELSLGASERAHGHLDAGRGVTSIAWMRSSRGSSRASRTTSRRSSRSTPSTRRARSWLGSPGRPRQPTGHGRWPRRCDVGARWLRRRVTGTAHGRCSTMRSRSTAEPHSRSRPLGPSCSGGSSSAVRSRSEQHVSTSRSALGTFDSLGAPLWSTRARTELARAGGTPDASAALTPTEERVAHLVAEGKTNREVAGELFVSVKTVEANLTRIFHKLGVRSRAELIRRDARGSVEEPGAHG